MKTKFTFALVLGLFFCSQLFSQSVCRTQLLTYTGPQNTAQLTTLINNSNNPIISNLSQTVKNHLINCTVFENGLPIGSDSNCGQLENLLSVSQAQSVLSAIFGAQVTIYSYETKPVYPVMSLTEFMNLYNSDPTAYAFTTSVSRCYNCYFKKDNVCCEVNGNGCYDFTTEIIRTGIKYYIQN